MEPNLSGRACDLGTDRSTGLGIEQCDTARRLDAVVEAQLYNAPARCGDMWSELCEAKGAVPRDGRAL